MTAYNNPLKMVPSSADLELHAKLCSPRLATEKLGEAVPLMKFIGAQVEQITVEKTVITAALLARAMNQNGTHQSSVLYLLADYTLSAGMFAALPGCYTVGIHDRCNALPIEFWLKSGQVQHRQAGTGLIRAEASIDPEAAQQMREQLIIEGRCELSGSVYIYQNDGLIGVCNHVMGAGLSRDPIPRALTDKQGVAIAQPSPRVTAQPPTLLAARTRYLVDYLLQEGSRHTQVVVLGAGLDAKSVEFAHPEQTWFLCDLPETLRHREERFSTLGYANKDCVPVAVDLKQKNWARKIIEAGFDPRMSSLILYEGMSMYFPVEALAGTVADLKTLVENQASRLWFDYVTSEAIKMDYFAGWVLRSFRRHT